MPISYCQTSRGAAALTAGRHQWASLEKYGRRRESLEDQFLKLFDRQSIEGKRVLDWCGSGALSLVVARIGAGSARRRSSADAIEAAKKFAEIPISMHNFLMPAYRLSSNFHERATMRALFRRARTCHFTNKYSRMEARLAARRRTTALWIPHFHSTGHHLDTMRRSLGYMCSAQMKVVYKVGSNRSTPEPASYWDLDAQRQPDRSLRRRCRTSDYLDHLTIAKFEQALRRRRPASSRVASFTL